MERAYGDLEVTVVLLGVFDLTVEAVAGERDFAVDGTGLSTPIKDNWENYLVGKRKYAVFEKPVCMARGTGCYPGSECWTPCTATNPQPSTHC